MPLPSGLGQLVNKPIYNKKTLFFGIAFFASNKIQLKELA
jgi:hypothetical protein